MLDDLMNVVESASIDDIVLTPADESAIFLAAMQDVCTPEEYHTLVTEQATEMELYGLIESAEIATEARKIVYKQTKQMNLNREQAKAALRMAKRENSADWKKYARGRKMMMEARDAIFKKHASKAMAESRRIINNASKKASSLKKDGRDGRVDINAKIQKKVAEVNKKAR